MKTKRYTESPPDKGFNSTMLQIGEMAEKTIKGEIHVLLKTYAGLISLTNPNFTWESSSAEISCRKLISGEGITLIQE